MMSRLGNEVVLSSRTPAYEYLQRLSPTINSKAETGRPMSRISCGTGNLQELIVHGISLDEATSSVDTAAETLTWAAIERLVEGRATCAIAHRLSTCERRASLSSLRKAKSLRWEIMTS